MHLTNESTTNFAAYSNFIIENRVSYIVCVGGGHTYVDLPFSRNSIKIDRHVTN